jgi:hypothetical protein
VMRRSRSTVVGSPVRFSSKGLLETAQPKETVVFSAADIESMWRLRPQTVRREAMICVKGHVRLGSNASLWSDP